MTKAQYSPYNMCVGVVDFSKIIVYTKKLPCPHEPEKRVDRGPSKVVRIELKLFAHAKRLYTSNIELTYRYIYIYYTEV